MISRKLLRDVKNSPTNINGVFEMNALNKMRRGTLGVDVNRMHAKTRQAAKYHPLVYTETCFSGRSKLTMEQLKEMSVQRQQEKLEK